MLSFGNFAVLIICCECRFPIQIISDMGRSHGGGDNFEKCSEKNYLKIFLSSHYFVLTGLLKPHS